MEICKPHRSGLSLHLVDELTQPVEMYSWLGSSVPDPGLDTLAHTRTQTPCADCQRYIEVITINSCGDGEHIRLELFYANVYCRNALNRG